MELGPEGPRCLPPPCPAAALRLPSNRTPLPQARPSCRSPPSTGAFCPQTDTCWSLWQNPASLLVTIPRSPWKHPLPQEALQAALSSRDVAQSVSGVFPTQPVTRGRQGHRLDERAVGRELLLPRAEGVSCSPQRPGPSPGRPAPCGGQGQHQREQQTAALAGVGGRFSS